MAEQVAPKRQRVALKLYHAVVDSVGLTKRIAAETESLRRIVHPSIALVLNGGISDAGHPFLVMELVQGLPIRPYCDQRRLGLTLRMELIQQIGNAVHYAHEQGISFCDIKLSDIRIATCNGIPVPKIIGFERTRSEPSETENKEVPYHLGTDLGSMPGLYSPDESRLSDAAKQANIRSLGELANGLLFHPIHSENGSVDNSELFGSRWCCRHKEGLHTELPLSSAVLNESLGFGDRPSNRFARRRELEDSLLEIVKIALQQDHARKYSTAGQFASDMKHLRIRYSRSSRSTSGFWVTNFASKRSNAILLMAIACVLLTGILLVWLTYT